MRKQQGFTIIELVVVILLLGILTATALPRFMDVTDEAHGAVVDGVQAGLVTGLALYQAQWLAEGQPLDAVLADFGDGTLYPDETSGFPDSADGTLNTNADCVAIYNGLLQNGRPTIEGVAYNADAETAVEGAAGTTDFVAVPDHATTPAACTYYYIGQYSEGTSTSIREIPALTYTVATGAITASSLTLNTD